MVSLKNAQVIAPLFYPARNPKISLHFILLPSSFILSPMPLPRKGTETQSRLCALALA
jgi:hypothetical protein